MTSKHQQIGLQIHETNSIYQQVVTSIDQILPDDWESKTSLFFQYVTRKKQIFGLEKIGNMDKIPVTFYMLDNFTLKVPSCN